VEADLTQRARLVPSRSLYLLHGLADLTAPYTHGVAFAKALSEAGVIFRYQVKEKRERAMRNILEKRSNCLFLFFFFFFFFRKQSYADEDHALTGVLEHAYRSMEDFLAKCLALDDAS
jgi:hypothetical protein